MASRHAHRLEAQRLDAQRLDVQQQDVQQPDVQRLDDEPRHVSEVCWPIFQTTPSRCRSSTLCAQRMGAG